MSGEGDGFISRWSRLKREGEKRPEPEKAAAEPVEQAVAEEPFDPAKLDIPLPSLDDLKPGDSLKAFMQKGVPEALKNAALRKMWALDPMVRDFRSEALDYAWDFNSPGGVPVAGPLGEADKVEEMVEAIFRQFEEPPEKEPETTDAAPEPAIGPMAEVAPEPAAETPDETLSASPGADPLPRRRHGGALPQV